MKLHGNARTCPKSRALIARRVLKQGWSLAQAAEAAGVSVVTARKWAARFSAGDRALEDRSSHGSRGFGWEFVHVMVDDHSRLAYVEVLADERSQSAVAFLRRGVSWFKGHGVRVQAVMSDNGSCYRSNLHGSACRELHLKHVRT